LGHMLLVKNNEPLADSTFMRTRHSQSNSYKPHLAVRN